MCVCVCSLCRGCRDPVEGPGSMWRVQGAGVQSHLVVAIKVSKLLHLKQVPLHREERHLRVFQDRQRDGGQFQAVLLQTEDFETWTLGDLWWQDGDLEEQEETLIIKMVEWALPLPVMGSKTYVWESKTCSKHSVRFHCRNLWVILRGCIWRNLPQMSI